MHGAAGQRERASARRRASSRARRPRRRPRSTASRRRRTATLQHPRCVFQILKQHYARYTPEFVAEHVRLHASTSSSRSARRCARTRAASGRRAFVLRGRLDAAHRRRPEHPHGRDHPAAAREHRPARRRDHGAARPRVDPGLDRHPDALQHPARLPADAAHASTYDDLDDYIEANTSPTRLVGPLRRLLSSAC